MVKTRGSEDPPAKLQSLECPRCGCRHMYVVDTRSTPKRIIRIRECRHCGRRLRTYEQFAAYAATFHDAREDHGCPRGCRRSLIGTRFGETDERYRILHPAVDVCGCQNRENFVGTMVFHSECASTLVGGRLEQHERH